MDIYQTVTDRIIAELESGCAPWLKPWKDGKAGSALEPHNAVTGRPYNGINWLLLQCSAFASQGWLTFKQAKELGGSVRKGEKGMQIVFWQFNKMREESGEVKTVPFAKAYTVFNLDQCDGLDFSKIKNPVPAVAGETPINAIADRVGAIVKHGGNKAFFSPSADFVAMPSLDAFESPEAYQATLAHELTHWTGHKVRLGRVFGQRFGDNAYAFEELVAEIGSAFVCAAQGVRMEGLQHSAYLANWLSVLKSDKRAIFTACSKAKEAAELLNGKGAE